MGAIFNDGTLNLQYIDPDSGEINPIFTHKEENNRISIRCEICGLPVVEKVSLDTHRTGKKHKANLEKYEMSGKCLVFPPLTLFFDKFKRFFTFLWPFIYRLALGPLIYSFILKSIA